MKEFIHKNIKVLSILIIVIIVSVVGFSLAGNFNSSSNINLIAKEIKPIVRFEKDESGNPIQNLTNTGAVAPIKVDINNIDNIASRDDVLKLKFWVSGEKDNPEESIYDISLHNVSIDCVLRNPFVKWVLYKNNNLLSSGNFSPSFDVMDNDRLVLTNTQEDLKEEEDEYLFVIYIEEDEESDESNLLGRNISGDLSIETSTKSKWENKRATDDSFVCPSNNVLVEKIACVPDMEYNGKEQSLIKGVIPEGVTVNQSVASKAGKYNVIAKLNRGYSWNDETTSDYIVTCNIKKRSITISSLDQENNSFKSSPEYVSAINLVDGDTISSIKLNTIKTNTNDVIEPNKAIIHDINGNDVTDNYLINYQSLGRLK